MTLIDNHGNPVDPYAPLGECSQCGAAAWTTSVYGLLCPDHTNVLLSTLPAEPQAVNATIDVPPVSPVPSAAGRQAKEIVYDRETRDYAMLLDGELVGFARTFHEAEVTLDQLTFELISGQSFTAARPAEPAAELLYACPCNEDIGPWATQQAELAKAQYTPAPTATADQAALVAAPTAATLLLCEQAHALAQALFERCQALHEARIAEIDTGAAGTTPLARAVERARRVHSRASARQQRRSLAWRHLMGLCPCCAGEHDLAHCHEYALEWRRQALGEELWDRYRNERDAFVQALRDAGETLRLKWASALDAYFLGTFGRSGGVNLILRDWQSLVERAA